MSDFQTIIHGSDLDDLDDLDELEGIHDRCKINTGRSSSRGAKCGRVVRFGLKKRNIFGSTRRRQKITLPSMEKM